MQKRFLSMNKAIAIITARGGSKRIPRKNIRSFCGKPIIAYSIEAALQSDLFDEVMVSTDDNEIAEVAQSYGANIPFMRSAATSDDFANTNDVIYEVLENYASSGKRFNFTVCIYPTAPFVSPALLTEAMNLLQSSTEINSVMPVTKYSFPPQRAMIIEDNSLAYWMPEKKDQRSQDLEAIYHDAGQFYCCKTEAFYSTRRLAAPPTAPIILSNERVQDIDTYDDWTIAELKFQLINGRVK